MAPERLEPGVGYHEGGGEPGGFVGGVEVGCYYGMGGGHEGYVEAGCEVTWFMLTLVYTLRFAFHALF